MKKAFLSLAFEVFLVVKASAQLCSLYSFKTSENTNYTPLQSILVPSLQSSATGAINFNSHTESRTYTNTFDCEVNKSDSSVRTSVLASTPIITMQPQPVSGCLSGSYTFTVIASPGQGGTLRYQWRKNGRAIVGATCASYTITNASNTDVANYSCLIEESNGTSIISDNASMSLVNCYFMLKTTPRQLSSILPLNTFTNFKRMMIDNKNTTHAVLLSKPYY